MTVQLRGNQSVKQKNTQQTISAHLSDLCPFPDCSWETLTSMAFVLDNLPVCIAYVDKDQRYLYNNSCYEDWFGVRAEDCYGKHVREILGLAVYQRSKPNIEKVLAGNPVRFQTVITLPAGETRDIQVSYQPDIDDQGQCRGFAVFSSDITQEQDTVRALETSRQQYQQLFEEMATGLILFEVIPPSDSTRQDYRFLKVNKAWQTLTGISAHRVLGKSVSKVSPRTEDYWYDALERVHWTGQAESMEDYFVELGRFYQVSIFRPQQDLLALSFIDITERKLAEQRLAKKQELLRTQLNRSRKSQEKTLKRLQREIDKRSSLKKQLFLSDSVFLYTSEGICITDAKGTIEQVNPAFTAITGYTANEAVGKKPSILRSNHHEPRFYKEMWHRLLTRGSWSGEIWNRRKNGEAYLEYLAITAVADEHDKVTHYVALFHDISELKASRDKVLHQSLHDALTGLPNRVLLADHCETLIVQADQHDENLAVVLIDIDDFRNINESLGYEIGDLVLQYVAGRISECCRARDVVARMGGDKFALLLPDIKNSHDDVLLVATRVMDELSASFTVHEHQCFVNISIGIAFFPEHGRDTQVLLQKAEMALYKAKELGKSRVTVFTEEVSEVVQRRIELMHKLRLALERSEFELYYQPKIRLDNFLITGVEALIRWQGEDGEIVGPDEFIPLVEQSDLIIDLGDWVIEQACSQLRIWHDQGYSDLTMAVNLSARQFLDPDLVDKLFSVLDRNRLKAHSLHLEITEHTMVEYITEATIIMERLARHGFVLSIDDFGTGFSSLAYLKQFPITTLKIDRSFIKDLPVDSHDKTIVSLVQSLAKSLGMSVIAEGVETWEQLDFLRQLNCDEFQGYLCSRPLPAKEFERFIVENDVWVPQDREKVIFS